MLYDTLSVKENTLAEEVEAWSRWREYCCMIITATC